jgi:hypothetical protein
VKPHSDQLELYLDDTRQLFNSLDPAPFHQRDLDPDAAEYIVEWAEDAPRDKSLHLVLRLGNSTDPAADAALAQQSVRDHFRRRAAAKRRELSHMLRIGRYSLLIALLFLGPIIVIAESAANLVQTERYAALIENSLVIGAWVALWRPLEIFLYDWWPLRAEARQFDRLGSINVTAVQIAPDARNAASGDGR